MADSASESDSSSIDGGPIMMPPSPVTREQLQKRIESLQQQNRVLKVELETYKLRVKALQEENRGLRQASVIIVSLKHVTLMKDCIVGVCCDGIRKSLLWVAKENGYSCSLCVYLQDLGYISAILNLISASKGGAGGRIY
jgi:hypothetical protein